MAKRDFDNLLHVIHAEVDHTTNATSSVEVDLELSRGFIAKIRKIIFGVRASTIRGVYVAATPNQTYEAAVLRDPDDAVTVVIPDIEVQHDVICDYGFVAAMDAVDDTVYIYETEKTYEFSEDEDVISARNLRYNCAQGVTDPDASTFANIFYTLEEVTDDDIMALLEIL